MNSEEHVVIRLIPKGSLRLVNNNGKIIIQESDRISNKNIEKYKNTFSRNKIKKLDVQSEPFSLSIAVHTLKPIESCAASDLKIHNNDVLVNQLPDRKNKANFSRIKYGDFFRCSFSYPPEELGLFDHKSYLVDFVIEIQGYGESTLRQNIKHEFDPTNEVSSSPILIDNFMGI